MSENNHPQVESVFSKSLRAGRRTYFFDVRATKANDYFLTITESKKTTKENGAFFFKKHKIFLYKEDFKNFSEILEEVTKYITDKKGHEVISNSHQPNYGHKSEGEQDVPSGENESSLSNLSFEDL